MAAPGIKIKEIPSLNTTEEKIERLRELIKEIDSYEECLFMYEIDHIHLNMAKEEVFEILRTL